MWEQRSISSARADVNLGPSLVCSVAKDVYFDKQAAEADMKKEEAAHKHPKQSEDPSQAPGLFDISPVLCGFSVWIHCVCVCVFPLEQLTGFD